MACEICGRNSCTRSFHDFSEQRSFDEIADTVKDRMKSYLKYQMESLQDYSTDDNDVLVRLTDVIEIINSY